MMLRLFCSVLLLCLTAQGVNVIWRQPGETVTFECCFDKCPSSIADCPGMYLYHFTTEREEVLFYYHASASENFSPRERYSKRVEKKGILSNHSITMRHLNENDSGIYKCVYMKYDHGEVVCNDYVLFISAPSLELCPTLTNRTQASNEDGLPLLLITVATSAISIFSTMVVVLLIIKVKNRRRTRTPPDNVYEMMTKNRLQPMHAPE